MQKMELENLGFAQGWLEGQINSMRESAQTEEGGNMELAEQCWNMWELISNGLDALIKENTELQQKIALAKNALN